VSDADDAADHYGRDADDDNADHHVSVADDDAAGDDNDAELSAPSSAATGGASAGQLAH